jgi:amino acid adenylation domain-containing protein
VRRRPRLHELVTRAAHANPANTAVAMGDDALSYGELEVLSSQLATLLATTGVVPGDRVCLCQRKGPDAVVAILGALKAGATCVPLDVDAPLPRLRAMSEAVRPRVVLGDRATEPLLPSLWPAATIGSLDDGLGAASFGRADVLAQPPRAPAVATAPEAEVAQIMFTSGSTGTPKGVSMTHTGLGAFIAWAASYFGYRPDDRMSCHSPFFFDMSTLDLFGAFAAGAAVHLIPPGPLSPQQVVDFVKEAGITQWYSVPGVLGYLVEADVLEHGCMPSLRRIISGGDVLRPKVLRHWMEHVPHARYVNLYGPTEGSIASTYHEIREPPGDDLPLPVGVACAGEAVYVLDEQGRPRADGALGEICLGGVGVGPGYWEDPVRTAQAFVHVPALGLRMYRTGDLGRMQDGVLHFVGRRDAQIKTRGYRVELGDVEAGLATIADIADCVVVGVPAPGFEGKELCCAWIARSPGCVTSSSLRRQAAAVLPAYMVPSRWRELQALPRTANGKHDRRAIAQLFAAPVRPSARSARPR